MFKSFKKDNPAETVVAADPYGTVPAKMESAIIRNNLNTQRPSEMFDRAREIYSRARRTGQRRSAGII